MQDEKQALPKWLQSSVDPTQVSNRVRGLSVLLGGALVWVFTQLGQTITPDQISEIFDLIGTIAGAVASAYGLVQIVYGAILALLVRIRN